MIEAKSRTAGFEFAMAAARDNGRGSVRSRQQQSSFQLCRK
jgi:hypothetical protein